MALKGIVIDAGHGGSDPGAVSDEIIEKDYTLLISKYMYDRFKELGVPVKLTRDTDISLTPQERTTKAQSFFGNDKDVIVISNHLNAGGGDGAETIYALRNKDTLARKILEEIEFNGQNIRKYYQQRLPSNPIKDYYFMHRNTPDNETVIVEYGFLDSKKDDIEQIKNNYEKYAEAVVKAICEYKGIKYIAKEDSEYYTVVKGDTLYSIANKYGLTVNELKELNNLSTNNLEIGKTLKVKKDNELLTEDYLIYQVKSGDTLSKIANNYNTTITILKDINNLNNDTIYLNQQLFIPKTKETGVENVYIIKNGDTLYSIANKYNTTVNELKEINNLSTNNLKVWDILKLPTKTEEISYIVTKGDNLYTIANKYNTTVDAIKELNNLSTNTLQIGDILKIPGSTDYNTYIVEKGDTLYKIANTYNTTINKIMTINNLETTNLNIGDKILIPK